MMKRATRKRARASATPGRAPRASAGSSAMAACGRGRGTVASRTILSLPPTARPAVDQATGAASPVGGRGDPVAAAAAAPVRPKHFRGRDLSAQTPPLRPLLLAERERERRSRSADGRAGSLPIGLGGVGALANGSRGAGVGERERGGEGGDCAGAPSGRGCVVPPRRLRPISGRGGAAAANRRGAARSGREMAEAAAAATLERLEALSCPTVAPVVPLEPAEALRLLCTPSAQRLALLEWVCSRVHPHLAARLDALRYGPKDARLRELAKLGAQLMLCRPDDMALVEGTAPPEQQLEFIRDLLDAAPPPENEGNGSPDGRYNTLQRTARFLHEVLETPEGMAALNPPSPPPLLISDGYDSPPPPRPRPSGPELDAALGAARRHLELLEAQNPELGGSSGPAPPVLPTLRVAGRDLAALATAFGAVELQDPWGALGSGAPPTLAPCGPLAPPVCQGLQQLMQSLEAVAQLGDTAAEVMRLAGGGRHRAMETRVAALQQRFQDVPKAGGPPKD
ncbi:HAUS augmin-like complex subunit 7 isoform X2 [Haliaeetus albicilla]|uniref:HAUS augmin-like complex subunit 7 isoform X2 n=1 Tax=Haliaeetus albicilla TaxID=8969 RepID=UPI0037E7278E